MQRTIIVFEDSKWPDFLPLVYVRGTFDLLCGRESLLGRVRRLTGKHSNPTHQRGERGDDSISSLADASGYTPTADAASSLADASGYDREQETSGPMAVWCRPEMARLCEDRLDVAANGALSSPALLLSGRAYWQALPPEISGAAVGIVGDESRIACVWADETLARRLSHDVCLHAERFRQVVAGLPRIDVSDCVRLFDWPWEIIRDNEDCLIGEGRELTPLNAGRVDVGAYILAPEQVQIGAGTRIKPCVVIDAEDGPVWIGERVTILPHCYVQGPAVIGDGTLLQPGAVVHAGTTIGPRCKIGGEIEASIVQGYSNKQHDGFLGHSYIGSWVNIAADCINSDLKNTYGPVRVPINGREVDTGEMFVGMLMGDYSKAGINVSFPTGAVVGFCSNIFRPLSPKFVPSFAWLDSEDERPFYLERGIEIARKVMARRQQPFTRAIEARFREIAVESRRLESVEGVLAGVG